jgi:hypothetical protein
MFYYKNCKHKTKIYNLPSHDHVAVTENRENYHINFDRTNFNGEIYIQYVCPYTKFMNSDSNYKSQYLVFKLVLQCTFVKVFKTFCFPT